jgi:hypothetical protein
MTLRIAPTSCTNAVIAPTIVHADPLTVAQKHQGTSFDGMVVVE